MFEVRAIRADQTHDLRHRILRPHQSLDQCFYPNDDAELTAHFGAFDNDILVGIVSIYKQECLRETIPNAWQIRGMATEEAVRGLGAGKALVAAAVAYAHAQEKGAVVWCNARTYACGFYAKLGFQQKGAEFEVPDIGPHYIMCFV